jgi:3-hydroxyisobutyrate dehydrogenase-like beta-hydroxyacid dehydrogenase
MAQAAGVIGPGFIGQPIAKRIPGAGRPLAVYDIRPESLAERWKTMFAATPPNLHSDLHAAVNSATSLPCRRSSASRLH